MADAITVDLIDRLNDRLRFAGPKMRSLIANEMNKALTEGRRDIVEELMTKTRLKRKMFNDRLILGRASPSALTARITPIYGSRIYMTDYPFDEVSIRGGMQAIRLSSPIYRKNMRTAFLGKGGSKMYLRLDGRAGVRSVFGRTVPRLFEQFEIKKNYEEKIKAQIVARALSGTIDI